MSGEGGGWETGATLQRKYKSNIFIGFGDKMDYNSTFK